MKNAFDYFVIGAMVCMVVVSFSAGITACKPSPSLSAAIEAADPLVSKTHGAGPSIYTKRHDGHLFVAIFGGGILHHPDCPCGKP